MGEVYKARDSRLTRTVAIKVLPAHTAADAAARARFEREARAIATLSHPHICVVYDVGSQGDIDYLVMELLEGETLAERLAKMKGPLPLDQVLTIGIAIADALDKAHRAGIVHRDLKPANVMLTKSGPKLLDFGLAKLHGAASPVALSGESNATTAGPRTAKGTILGTIHYMSPEQVEGREADTRSDIWALGALLYEMATGQRPFDGESAASIVGAILKDTPPTISTRQPLSPPMLERMVQKCLAKDPDARWQSASDLRAQLEWVQPGPPGAVVSPIQPLAGAASRGMLWLPWALVVVAAGVAAALALPAVRHLRETPPQAPPETRTDIVTPPTDAATSFALSPDGRQIVFVASGDGAPRLWLRSMGATTGQPLPGTEGARYPFWSPDGHSVGFFASNSLKRIDLGGDAVRTLASANSPRGGAWGMDGTIVFAPGGSSPLWRVPSTGGVATVLMGLGKQQLSHRWPQMLPDGRHFMFYVQGSTPDVAGVYLSSFDGTPTTRLTGADGQGLYLPSGWMLWTQAGTLLAQRLDAEKAALSGEPLTLADGVATDPTFSRSALSVSATGLVAYRTGGASLLQLTWVDRSGTARGTVGDRDASFSVPRVSPDGRRVAVGRTVRGNQDLWLLEGTRTTRLTFDPAIDQFPVWAPDSTRIVFRSNRNGPGDLYQALASVAGGEERLLISDQTKLPDSWSPDGRFLLFRLNDPHTGADLWVLPMAGDRPSANSGRPEPADGRMPTVFLKAPFDELRSAFSPDGRWVAYHSNESGRNEVYVRAFVPPGASNPATRTDRGVGLSPDGAVGQWQVSTTGGVFPAWRPDGKELYFLNPAGFMMAAPIAVTGTRIAPGEPVALFPARIRGGGEDTGAPRQYDVAPDGRFLINTVLDGPIAPITLLMNWQPEAKK